MAHADLVLLLQQCWNPLCHHIVKVKSHRNKEDAKDIDDLYTILGHDFADQVAKEINKRDLPDLLAAANTISTHSKIQIESLLCLYLYLAELNALHSQLKSQKEHPSSDHNMQSSVDAFANYQSILCTWQVPPPIWTFDCAL